jgi:iron complex outermembrane recepter protein
MKARKAALWLSSAMSLAISMAAYAEPAAAPAAATAASSDEGIQEVIVTAEKRTENLQTVPVAISAYTSKSRDLLGIETIQDMTNFTPGLAYSTSLDRAFIRGVGRQTNNLATQPGVATYADNVYNSSVVAASGDSMFEDRIEVLRGPQGTLYGRNAIAGTINSISKRPTADWTAEVRADVGNYGLHNFEGVISGPITDTMRFKFGGYRNATPDGYYTNVFNGKTESSNLGTGNFFYWEGQLEWDITPDLQFWLKVDQLGYNDSYRVPTQTTGSYDYAPYPNYFVLFPGPGFGATVPGGYTPANAPATNPTNTNIYNFANDDSNNAHLSRTYQITPQLTWHGPGIDVKYLGAYTTYYYSLYNDYDGTAIGSYVFPTIPGTGGIANLFGAPCAAQCPPLTVFPRIYSHYIENKKYFSNEVDVSSHTDSDLQWIFGLYQYNERYFQTPGTLYTPDQPQVATPFTTTLTGLAAANPQMAMYTQQQDMHANSYAIFEQTDWKFLPTWQATLGLRYTYDEAAGSEQFRELCFGYGPCLGLPASLPGPAVLGAYTPVTDITQTIPAIANCVTAAGCLYPGVKGVPNLLANGNWNRNLGANWGAPTGTAGLQWTPTNDILAYFKYSRGYKSGGFNSSTIDVNPESQPEHIDAIELGGKVQFTRQFQLNTALFYYHYQGLQIPLQQPAGNGVYVEEIINLPKVINYGAEFEAIWQATANLQFLLDYSYLHATISDSPAQINTVSGQAENVVGNNVPESPRNKVAANGNYTWRFVPGALNLSASYVWKDKTPDSIFSEAYFVAPAYSQVDMRLSWNDAADRYTVFAYVKNLQNKLGYDGVGAIAVNAAAPGTAPCGTNAAGAAYFCDQTLGLTPPRTYGLEVQYRWK